MNKTLFMGAALTLAFAFTSCKSSESAYKKAYEKAQQAAAQEYTEPTQQYTTQQTTPVEVTPVTPTTVVTTTPVTTQPTTPVTTQPTTTTVVKTTPTVDYSNVAVRTENVTVVAGNKLSQFGVVVGSFSVQANAVGLQTKLNNSGLKATVVKAQVNGNDWYRVVAASFNTKEEAASFRATLQSQYPDAWLLYAK